MSTKRFFPLFAGLLITTLAHSQLDMGTLYTQTVKAGQPWAAIDTKVKNLTLRIEVNRGVVTTVATLEYTPGNGQIADVICGRECINQVVKEVPLDSLETTAPINLADNTVLTDMYLWVGDTKVKADLQERALASAQYEDIVKRRRDPALLETWGNGHYNLRIFPNESGKSRKIEIEFVQGMEDEGALFRTVLPILHRLTKVASIGMVDYANLPNRTMDAVSLTAVALDGKTYDLKWEGLGSGTVGPVPLRLSAAKVAELKEGVLSSPAATCSGCLTPWVAEKTGLSHFGVKALLIAKQIKFEAEPLDRDVLLDVDGKDTAMTSRARKVALLSLKAYGAAPHAANLGIPDGKGGMTYLFPKAVPMDAPSLRAAYDALRAWTPGLRADAHQTLRSHAKARGAGAAPSVAILVNNDTTPWFNWSTLPNGTIKAGSQAEYEAWEKARSAMEDQTLAALQGAQARLFGFWNDYRLNRIATATGGFQVGSLYGYIYHPMRGGVVADLPADKTSPIAGIHLPPLFGPDRPDAYTIADLKVSASGPAVDRLAVLQAQTWFYYGGMVDIGVARPMLAKGSDFIGPYGYASRDTLTLRISGQYRGTGRAVLKVTGLWGGLRFSQELSVDLPSTQSAGSAGAGIWAYQLGESWARGGTAHDIKAVQQLGKDHHIVNRQMSLLALEPGMDLWTEMPSREGTQGGPAARDLNSGASLVADDKMGGTIQNTAGSLDLATLEQILAAGVPVLDPGSLEAGGPGDLSLRRSGAGWSLGWTVAGLELPQRAVFRILDLSGRSVAELAAVRTTSGFSADWRNPSRPGAYFVIAQAGDRTLIRKFVARP